MMYGNLLALSTDGRFGTPIWATVVSHDPTKSTAFVELCGDVNQDGDATAILALRNSKSTLVVESPSFFAAYRPVLYALQNIDMEKVRFSKYLYRTREMANQVLPPEFMRNEFRVDWSIIFTEKDPSIPLANRSITHLRRSPHCKTTLDERQLDPVELCLSKEVALIQGPPGCGKSFIAHKVLQLLLTSPDFTSMGPILVVCFKNKALDDLLVGCLKFTKNIVRIGGRGKRADLEDYNMATLLKNRPRDGAVLTEMNAVGAQCDEIADGELKQAMARLESCENIDHGRLIKLLGQVRVASLVGVGKGDAMAELKRWLPPPKVFKAFERRIQDAVQLFSAERFVETILDRAAESADKIMKEEEEGEDDDEVEREEKEAQRKVGSLNMAMKNCKEFPFAKVNASSGKTHICGHIPIPFEIMPAESRREFLMLHTNISKLEHEERVLLIQLLMTEEAESAKAAYTDAFAKMEALRSRYAELEAMGKLAVLKNAKIIAATSNGAATNLELLKAAAPSILLIEEAGELLEPHLLSALSPSIQQLIMIGDHYQLRPPVTSYRLAKHHHLDVSLFERMINNGMTHVRLRKQCRMRDEFLPMLKPVYPDLESFHELIRKNHPANCVAKSSYFWTHQFDEVTGRSPSNPNEAAMIVFCIQWMVANGITGSQITVIAMYSGQVAGIRRLLKASTSEEVNAVEVHTVDNFQGDENDFILVSLVRSNPQNQIGHCKLRNRRVVASSRARCGVYFFGNGHCFAANGQGKKENHWGPLIETMKGLNRYGVDMPLTCATHPSIPLPVRSAENHRVANKICKVCEKGRKLDKEREEQARRLQLEEVKKQIAEKVRELDRKAADSSKIEVVRTVLDPKANAHDFNQMKDLVEKYIQPAHGVYFTVVKVERVVNLELERRFWEARKSMIDPVPEPVQKFHGTSDEGVVGITTNGFNLPAADKNNMFGQGIYFATDSSKSGQSMYTKGSNCLLVCDVLLGKVLTAEKDLPCHGTYIVHFRPHSVKANFNQLNPILARNKLPGQPYAFKIIEPGRAISEFEPIFALCDSRFKRYQHLHNTGTNYHVTKVKYIINPMLETAYSKIEREFKAKGLETEEIYVFHGTDEKNIEPILREGFKIGGQEVKMAVGAMHGPGVYLAVNSAISVGYARGGKSMLMAKVLLNKKDDYDQSNVIVARRKEQVLPFAVVYFE
ncbi:NFX1-type zinc finger-containing protein 1 [Rhizophlyctis rosea]|nr:NFX1-type zinc finger-containing protein 1 [Rhizophlyctis rosea]